ncbi:hypothetical protein M0R72_16300 [Candidatus Pacearchaeota archaeon]|jgi:hypothetical protein|nr:hypothetical protein [Candidatus Pacearchaeota archaeon]
MALHILNDPGRAAGLGSAMGQGFGSGFGSAIQAVTQNKLNQMLEAHNLQARATNIESALEAAGKPANFAKLLALMPAKQMSDALNNMVSRKFTSTSNGTPKILQGQQQGQQLQSNTTPLEQFSQNGQQQAEALQHEQVLQQQLSQLMGHNPMDALVRQHMGMSNQGLPNNVLPQQQQLRQPIMQRQQGVIPQQQQQPVSQQNMVPQEDEFENIFESPAQRNLRLKERKFQLDIAKEQREMAKEQRMEQHRINKEVMPEYKEIIKDSRSAKEDDRRLGKIEKLVEHGDLTRPRWHSLLNTLEHGIFGFGVNLHSLETADSQEFDKLSKEFLKNAKNIFGARITDNDVKVFLKMVPDLSQSREGKLAIIHNMKLYNEGKHLRKTAAEQILKANNGKLPGDFIQQVEDIAGPELDKLATRFITDKQVAPAQEELSTLEKLTGTELPSANPLDYLFGRG